MAHLGPDSYRIPEQPQWTADPSGPPAEPPPPAYYGAPPGPAPAYAPPGPPRQQRPWDRWEWQWAAIGGAVLAGILVLAVVVGLGHGTGTGGATSSGKKAAVPALPGLPGPPTVPAAKFSPAQLQAMLPGNGNGIPAPYSTSSPALSLPGLPFPEAPQKITCSELHDFFGELTAYDINYAAEASVTATDSSLDTMSVVIMESDSVSYAQQDVAALRAAGSRCPTTTSSIGTWRVSVGSVPGLGDDNVNVAMAASSPGPDGTQNGPQDILLARQGSDLVEVDYQLSSPPGPSQSGLGPSVVPPSATIIRSILARL
jgi:hypothetical protein